MLMDPPHCLHGGLLDAHMNNSNKEIQSLQHTHRAQASSPLMACRIYIPNTGYLSFFLSLSLKNSNHGSNRIEKNEILLKMP